MCWNTDRFEKQSPWVCGFVTFDWPEFPRGTTFWREILKLWTGKITDHQCPSSTGAQCAVCCAQSAQKLQNVHFGIYGRVHVKDEALFMLLFSLQHHICSLQVCLYMSIYTYYIYIHIYTHKSATLWSIQVRRQQWRMHWGDALLLLTLWSWQRQDKSWRRSQGPSCHANITEHTPSIESTENKLRINWESIA